MQSLNLLIESRIHLANTKLVSPVIYLRMPLASLKVTYHKCTWDSFYCVLKSDSDNIVSSPEPKAHKVSL